MREKKWILIAAAFGGVAANLLKIGMLLTAGPVTLPSHAYMFSYTAGLVILAAIGGVTAMMLRETSIRKAFFIGMGLPTLFQMSTTNYSTIHSEADNKVEVTAPKTDMHTSWALINIAYADNLSLRGGTLIVTCEDSVKPDRVTLYSKDQKSLQLIDLDFSESEAKVTLPANVESFTVHYQDASSAKTVLDSLDKPAITVKVKERSLNGLWNAIGVKDTKNFEVQVSKN